MLRIDSLPCRREARAVPRSPASERLPAIHDASARTGAVRRTSRHNESGCGDYPPTRRGEYLLLILFEDRTTGQDRATIHGWKDCRARRAALSPGPGQAEAGPDAWPAAAIWAGTCERWSRLSPLRPCRWTSSTSRRPPGRTATCTGGWQPSEAHQACRCCAEGCRRRAGATV